MSFYSENSLSRGGLLEGLSDKIIGFEQVVEDYTRSLMNGKYRTWLIEQNQLNISEGKRADESEISKTPIPPQVSELYEPSTVKKKQKAGNRYDFVNLYDTGNFVNSERILTGSDEWYFSFSDSKAEEIMSIWGDVGGINAGQREELIEMIRVDLIELTKKYFEII